MVRHKNSLIAANSAEIRIQQLVFLLVVFPLTGLFFPAISFYWAIYAFISLSVQFGWLKESAHQFILSTWPQFIVISILLSICIYTALVAKKIKDVHKQPSDRRLKIPPESEKGAQLIGAVGRIWQAMGRGAGTPTVRWFANFNVLARAAVSGGEQIIEVSSGLWERVIKNEWIAELILAHEAAHLIHGDIKRFRQLDILTSAVRKIIRALLWISLIALIFAWIYEIMACIRGHQPVNVTAIHIIGAPIVALFVLLPLVVGEWVIRRYGGFITSLMELRADITAKEWLKTIGRVEDGQNADPAIHQTTLMEFGHSLVSINLTHISETERFNILKSNDRLLSPKLRYFGLSLFLALLVPLNSFTPMLYNGAIDHLFVAATIIALHLILFAMLFFSPEGMHLSLRRSFIVALALFLATGLTTINTYQLGYYLTAFGAAFFAPNGFAEKLLDWPTLAEDFGISVGGMMGEFADAFHPVAALLSIILSGIMTYLCSVMLSKTKHRLRWLGFVLISVAALLAVYDPNRKEFYPALLSKPASWMAELPYFADMRYILPSFLLLLYTTIVYYSTKRNSGDVLTI